MPVEIIHDQGHEFENWLFQQLQRWHNIKGLRKASYHPQCNSQIEKMNQSIISILKTLERTEKTWKNQINKLVHTYNHTKNASFKVCSILFLFGQKLWLPINLILAPNDVSKDKSNSKFMENRKTQMSEAYQIALKESN